MSEQRVYSWTRQSYKVSPQTVGEAVERITREKGFCTPAHLVTTAMRKNSPLRPLFTWNDAEAADKWRTHEARNIINSLSVTVKVNDREERVPAFISVGHVEKTQESGEGYRPFRVVVQTPEFHDEALHEVMSRLETLRRRYAALTELAPVWEALDQVKAA